MKVTIDGYDPYSGITLTHITIWGHPTERKMIIDKGKPKLNMLGLIKHGKKIKLISRHNDEVTVKHKGKIGYLKYWFILEFKGELLDRLANENKI